MIWHEAAWQCFLTRAQQQQVHHAQLIESSAGCGGEQFIWRMANYLLCERVTESGACGSCQSCRLIQADQHPDCIVFNEDNHHIDQLRQCQQKIQQSAQLGRYKVVVFLPVECLTLAASHALLKMLEEGPSQTLFLLYTNQRKRLLPTIISRCNRVRLPNPSHVQALAWLQTQASNQENSQADLQNLLDVYDGAPEAVQRSVGWPYFAELKALLLELKQDMKNLMQYADKLEKEELDCLFIGIFYWLKSFASNQQESIKQHEITQFWDFCGQKRQNWLKVATLNKRLLIESILIEWAKPGSRR